MEPRKTSPADTPPSAASAVPRYRIEDIANDYSDFYSKLSAGEIQMPCWLEVGDSGFKITSENHKTLALGMLLDLEVRGHFKR